MEYTEFITYIRTHIMEYLREMNVLCVDVSRVKKNNGIELDGLHIKKLGEMSIPAIYLNEYYTRFLHGESLEKLLEEIAGIYKQNETRQPFAGRDYHNFNSIKDLVIYRIINAKMNQKLLENVPHVRFLDLAIVFRVLAYQGGENLASSLVRNQEMERWDITRNMLLAAAREHSPMHLPHQIVDIDTYMKTEPAKQLSSPYNVLYVLTNQKGINGAVCMLYRNVLKDFSQKIHSDLYILPSSVNEVTLMPAKSTANIRQFHDQVIRTNHTSLAREEILSDHLYYYSNAANEIRILSGKNA